MAAASARHPESARLRRFEIAIDALKALLDRRVADAVKSTRDCLQEIQAPNFEFEAACNLLTLVARLEKNELHMEDLDHDVGALALRFAVSHAACDFLVRAILALPPFERIIREAYEFICAQAEEALSKTVNGDPGEAVRLLLNNFESSLNAKLLDLAIGTIERHGAQIDNCAALVERAHTLQQRYRSYGTQVSLSRASEPRSMAATARV